MSGLKMKYFVLKPRSKYPNDPFARASRKAMAIYAETIRDEDPEFASEVRAWANAAQEDEDAGRFERD